MSIVPLVCVPVKALEFPVAAGELAYPTQSTTQDKRRSQKVSSNEQSIGCGR
jgi:hypothetical protein